VIRILPFYLVVDQSESMRGRLVEALNSSLDALLHMIQSDPIATDHTRLEIIAFSDSATVVLPLSDLSDVSQIPPVRAGGATSYGAAFRLLRQEIAAAVRDLRSQAFQVFRPTVFFVSDGEPTDDWTQSYAELIGSRQRPNIVAFGIGGAEPGILSYIATHGAFLADWRTGSDAAIEELLRALGESIVGTGSSVSGGPTALTLRSVPGFRLVSPPRDYRQEPSTRYPTERDREILLLLAKGMSVQAIAVRIGLSERAVREIINTIGANLDVRSKGGTVPLGE
jgi:uncharacterized protein YegL